MRARRIVQASIQNLRLAARGQVTLYRRWRGKGHVEIIVRARQSDLHAAVGVVNGAEIFRQDFKCLVPLAAAAVARRASETLRRTISRIVMVVTAGMRPVRFAVRAELAGDKGRYDRRRRGARGWSGYRSRRDYRGRRTCRCGRVVRSG